MKKKLLKSLALGFVGSLVVTGSAMALPAVLTAANTADVSFLFDDIGSSINALTDEKSAAEVFRITSPIASAWQLHYDYSGTSALQFGLYNTAATPGSFTGADLLMLFDGANATPSGDVTVVFDGSGAMMSSTGFNHPIFDTADYMASFGFYVYDGAQYLLSESDLNAGAVDYFLAYNGKSGDTVQAADGTSGSTNGSLITYADDAQHWYILAEAGDNAAFDFDEIMVRTESMQPVPEPATMLLLGTGLAGFAGLGRRRKARKA